jgi:small subunit ribosomal protein S6
MREYETTFLIQPEISDEGRQALFGRLDGVLEKGGAIRLLYEDWGKRKLAFEIQKFQKAHYVMLAYLDAGKTVPEIERALRLEESVLRFLTVQVADEVVDIEARRARAAEDERVQAQKAAERAQREAEEQRAREDRAREEAERVAGLADDDEESGEDAVYDTNGDEEGVSR